MEDVRIVSRRGDRFERDWTKGSIIHNLLSLTWPIFISYILNMIGPFVDLIWVGRLGTASVAGVGIASMVVMLLTASTMGLTIGTRALIGRFVGAGDKEGANHAAMQALVIGVAYYIVVAPFGIFLAESIMSAFGAEADVVAEGAAYMRIMFVSSLAQSLLMMTTGIMQASGDAVMPMRISLIFRAVHLVICPFLVFGWWVFPRLGVSGAAAANAISQSLGVALGLWALFSGRTRLQLRLRNFRFDLNIIWRMVKVALPNLFMHIQHHMVSIALIWFMTPFGTLAVAAHTLWQRVDSVTIMIGMAIGTSAGVLGAQNLGANQPERAGKTGWLSAGITIIMMLVLTIVVLLWAETIASIFSPDPDLIKITGTFLRIAAVSYLTAGLNGIFMAFLIGVGDTFWAMLLETLQTWGVQLPLAYFLPRLTGLGVYGVRWAIVAGMVVAGIIFTLYFWLGKWRHKKV
jgi:putative MATE family efflux protein